MFQLKTGQNFFQAFFYVQGGISLHAKLLKLDSFIYRFNLRYFLEAKFLIFVEHKRSCINLDLLLYQFLKIYKSALLSSYFPSFRIEIQNPQMLSNQDIFIPMNQNDMVNFNSNQAPILKNQFSLNGIPVDLLLTDHYIILTETLCCNTIYHLQLNFSVKFEVIRAQWENEKTPGKPLGICLEKQNFSQKIQLLSSSPQTVNLWTGQLQKKINQRNFHKLFKAKRKIGKGAFATVYLAERLIDQKMFAVKAFSKQKQYSGEKGRQSLENEIKIMRTLSHQNIMKLQGIYETQNSIYVILEYLEGVQLNQEIKNHRQFTLEQTKTILRGLLSGISHLASKRIIHRDLKPENIMFRTKDSLQLVICDFGLATHADQEKYLFVRCGTPGFVAPEIINIKDMNLKSETISDVFSTGVIFHYLLFKKSVFQGARYSDILSQNRACDFNFQKQDYQKIDIQAFDLLKRMLEKNPQLRITAEQALRHPFLAENIVQKMEVQETQTKQIYPNDLFKEKEIQVLTPSTFKSQNRKMKLRKKNSSPPLSNQTNKLDSIYTKNINKQNQTGVIPLKKTVSNASRMTRSRSRKYQNFMIDEIQENQ